MPESGSERHDRLAREFVMHTLRTELRAGGDFASVMVIYESAMLAVMHILVDMFHFKPRDAVILVTSALERAEERFIQQRGKDPT